MRITGKVATAILGLGLLLAATTAGAAQPGAQGAEHHAGVVVQFAAGSVQTFCVAFTEDTITGLDALVKTGLDVQVQSYGAMGAEVCKIGQDGCNYPDQPCACQSYGPGGAYWTYHHLSAGKWVLSPTGASSSKVRDGDVDGWAWSSGAPPPLRTFAQVCSIVQPSPTTPATPRPAPTNTRRPLPTPSTTHQPRPAPTQTAPVALPQASNTPQPAITPTVTSTATTTAPPTGTPTISPTDTPLPTATSMPASTPTIAPAPTTSDSLARNVGIGIGAAILGVLAVWGVVAAIRNAHSGGNQHVE